MPTSRAIRAEHDAIVAERRAERDLIVDAARRYVAAWHAVDDAYRDQTPQIEYAAAFHALLVAVDRTCALCEPGTCPIAPAVVDTPPL